MLSYFLTLYYKKEAPYADEMLSIRKMLEMVSARWWVPVEVIEAEGLQELGLVESNDGNYGKVEVKLTQMGRLLAEGSLT